MSDFFGDASYFNFETTNRIQRLLDVPISSKHQPVAHGIHDSLVDRMEKGLALPRASLVQLVSDFYVNDDSHDIVEYLVHIIRQDVAKYNQNGKEQQDVRDQARLDRIRVIDVYQSSMGTDATSFHQQQLVQNELNYRARRARYQDACTQIVARIETELRKVEDVHGLYWKIIV